jgi:hypothetical protein
MVVKVWDVPQRHPEVQAEGLIPAVRRQPVTIICPDVAVVVVDP